MSYGYPVTGPMMIPYEEYKSQYAPPTPALNEGLEIEDSSISGIRLQGTLAKSLPGIKQAGSMTNTRAQEVEQYARDMSAAFDITNAYKARSKAIARAKDRMLDKAAKYHGAV